MTYGDLCRLFARTYQWPPEVIAQMTPQQANMYAPDLGRLSPMNAMGVTAGSSHEHGPEQWFDKNLGKMVKRGRRIG